jgi:ribosomal protein S21
MKSRMYYESPLQKYAIYKASRHRGKTIEG